MKVINITKIIRVLIIAVVLSAIVSPAQAITPTGWVDQKAELVSPEDAEQYLNQRDQTLTTLRQQQTAKTAQQLTEGAPALLSSSMAIQTDYVQLAEALENDPVRIYQYVRNHFKYEPYYGALKGPYLTLLERSGNDFDQAAILVELLRAAGITANFQYGSMDIPFTAADNVDIAHWLGTEADASIIGTIVATGGIPAINYSDHIVMDRVWVVADINSETVALDPAFKPSIKHNAINLMTAMGYTQADILAAAGGLLGTDSIEGLNSSALSTSLDTLTGQLISHLKQNHPNAHLKDIVGGLTIIKDESNSLPTSLPFVGVPTQAIWTDIPPSYVHTVRLQHGGIDTTLDIPTLAGKKLSISYSGSSTVIDPPPAGAIDFGTVSPGEDSPTIYTLTPGNPNAVTIQVTATISGTDANAFSFISGGGVQNISPGGSVQVKLKFTGLNQTPGRKNATLTLASSHNGSVFSSNDTVLTGAVESTPIAKIHLDDTLLIDEITPSGNLTDLVISIDHPYASDSGTFADQNNVAFPLKRSGTYVLASGFGGDRNSHLLAERQFKLDQMLLQGMANDSREVLTETLNITGQNWYKQTQLNAELLAQISDHRLINHHRFGIIGQEDAYFVDIKAQVSPTLAQSVGAQSGAFQASGFIASAMEHSVLEQLHGSDKPALSTIKIFDLNNQNNSKFFLANQSNFSSIQSQLTGYSSNQISTFQNAVNSNSILILPQNGQITLNSWSGNGYVNYQVNGSQRSLGMIIGGGLNGGYVTVDAMIDAAIMKHNTRPNYTPPANISTPKAADPVDLGSGAYLNQSTDLSLGGSGTRGLSFGRSYNSQQVNQNKAFMAPGWTHSYDINLVQHSDVNTALGLRSAKDAAALIVASTITRDLMQPTQPTLKAWVVTALIAQWATDQIIDKAVSVNMGDRVLSYRQQPDGSYTAPPSVTTNLIKQGDGTYQLQERFGNVLTFNADNKIQTLTDIDNNNLSFTYTADKLTQVKDSYNRTLTLNYNANNQLDQVSDNQGRHVTYGYTGEDLTSYQDAENKQWQYSYDSQHQIKTVTDPVNNIIVDNIYDAKGQVIQQTAPRDNNTSALYKMHYTGVSSSEEDPLGNRITYSYDNSGRTIKTENTLGHTSQVSYDGQGQVIKQTDPKGNESQLQYDGHNNLQFSSNALNQQTEFVYDSQQRLTETIDALTHSSEIDYDNKHHPIKFRNGEKDESNQIIESSVSYYTTGAEKGQVHTQTDARGTTSTVNYDSFGFTDTTKTGLHPVVNTDYNAIGQLTQLTDQQSASTTFDHYDKRGLLTQSTDPLNKQSHSSYDDAGRIKTQTDRNGNITTLDYSPTSKLKKITYQDSSEVSFSYDSRDNLKTMVDPSGTTSNNYDAINRLTDHTDPQGFQVSYAYDKNGNLETLTYPDNKTVTYGYDVLNRLKTVTIDWLNNTPSATYHYDAAGRMVQTDQANGSSTTYSHDKANRLKGVTHTANNQTLADYQYTLDANGNRIKALVEAPKLPERLINNTLGFNYNPQKNRLNNTDTASFSYDDEGQLKTKTDTATTNSTNYSFDYAHRLIQRGNDNYTYDGVGNRIKAIRNGIITKYIYDAAGNLLAEANSANQITRYYIYGHGMTGFVEASNNQLYTYHHDGTGHTVAITDQSQQTVNSYAYDPYGNIMGQSETIQQPFKYVGQLGVYAEENGLYYMRARYYDAEIGRFISEDPIGFAGGLNLYAYVGGNPLLLVDPSGLSAERAGFSSAQIARIQQDAFNIALNVSGIGAINNVRKSVTNVVYQGLDSAGVVRYVGITMRDAAIRFNEHLNSIGTGKEFLKYREIDGALDLVRHEAKIIEQRLIDQYGLGKNGGQLLNKINSISPKKR